MEYSAELKTVATEFKCSFTKEIKNGKVVSIKRDLCVNYESCLSHLRNFTPIWVSSLRSAKKNSVKKDVSCEAYLMAVDLDLGH